MSSVSSLTAPFWVLVDLVSGKEAVRDFRVALEDIEPWTGRLADGELANYEADGVPFQNGDVLFGKLRPYLAKFYQALEFGTAGGDIHVYRPKEGVFPRYVFYVVASTEFVNRANVATTGVKMPRTDWSAIRTFPVSLPSLDTQRAIANCLDRETGEIDAMLAKLEGLVGLLEERRENVVKETLSKHAPNAPWVQCKLICQINTGTGDTQDADENGDYPFYVRSQTPRRYGSWEFDGDAVLTAGDGAGVGKVFHLATGKFMAHQRVYVMNNFNGVTAPYFFHVFKWLFPSAARDGSAKSTVDSVRQPMIANLCIPLPPFAEQERIVAHLNDTTARIDRMIAKAHQLRDLIAERRSALITAAVTGQVEIG